MQGVSLLPAFAGKSLARNGPIYWEHEGNRALRSGQWKLVLKHRGPWELYNMEADRTERRNLIEDEPEVAKELIANWESWAARSDVDPWPGPARNDWGEEPPQPARDRTGS
jgi:arylsulfatase